MRIALPPALSEDALAGHDPAAPVIDLGGEAMGSRWQVRLAAPRGFDAAATRVAIEARIASIVRQMSQWEPNSLLSRFNRAPAGTWTVLPPDFAVVIDTGLAIATASGGAFDPAIGRLVDLWGFGPEPATGPPSDAAIDVARLVSGWGRLGWVAASRCLRQPGGLSLDLAGIAKGHAVDAVADLLGQRGVRHCVVDIGGELVGRGLRPNGEPWWVDLEAPPGASLHPLRVALHGVAVATSGDYVRGAHTLDPRTGLAAASGVVAASVIAASALQADAWATAITVLGLAGLPLADAHDIAARLVMRDGDEHLNSALNAMLAD